MVPINTTITTISEENMPSKTFLLKDGHISGWVDGLEAIKQAIYYRLTTEKYINIIYSWYYGIETYDLYGRDITYVSSEIKRRIEECLLEDDRINSVDDFEIKKIGKNVLVKCKVYTDYGEQEIEEAVTVV